MANFTPVGVEAVVKNLSGFTRGMNKMQSEMSQTGRVAEGIGGRFNALGKSVLGVGATMAKVGAGAVIGMGAAVTGLGVASVNTAISFESAFAGVLKTVDDLEDELGNLNETGLELRQGFRDMAKEVPLTVEELAKIGEIGGQLGVPKEALLDFTETVAALGVTTNLSTDEAATALARIANIFDVSAQDMGQNIKDMGNVIVELGNNFATTESEIATFALRIAGAGNIAGLTQADILGIGAAMTSVGVQAEAGGTAVQKMLIAMNNAAAASEQGLVDHSKAMADNEQKALDLNAQLVKLEAQTGITGQSLWDEYEAFKAAGGSAEEFGRKLGDTRRAQLFKTIRSMQELTAETQMLQREHGKPIQDELLATFARVSGRTVEEFQKDWEEDAAAVFTDFVEGLNREGDDAVAVLEELGLADQRLVRGFLSLANAGDLLGESMSMANAEFVNGSALTEEAEKRYRTTAAQFQLLKNAIRDVAITLGDALLPFINELISRARPLIEELGRRLPEAIENIIARVKELIGAFREGGALGLAEALGFSEGTIALMQNVANRIVAAFNFVRDHWEEFRAALIAVGALLGVAATIAAIGAAIALLTNPITLLIVAVGALGYAWQSNFLGIRDTLTAFWENTARPALAELYTWLQVNLPIAIATLSDFWHTTLLPALQAVWGFIINSVIPALSNVWTWLQTNVPTAIQTVAGFWQTTLLPALQTVWSFIQESVIPLLVTLVGWLQEHIPLALQTLSDFWQTTLLPALQTVWSFIQESIIPILSEIWTWLSENIPLAIETASEFWKTKLLPALTEIYDFINDYLVPLFEAIDELLTVVLSLAAETLANAWNNVMLPAFRDVRDFLEEKIIPIFDRVVEAIQPVVDFVGDLIGKLNILQGLDLKGLAPDVNFKEGFEGAKTAVSDLTGNIETFTGKLAQVEPPTFLKTDSPTPFEIGLLGIGSAFSEVLPAAITLFSEQAITLLTPVYQLIQQIDTLLVKIYEVTLVELANTTMRTTTIMISAFQSVLPVLEAVNALLEQMISILSRIAQAAKATATALIDGFKAASDVIEDKLLGVLEDLVEQLEKVKKAADEAASSVSDIGESQPTTRPPPVGAQHGADFVVPSGFPRDSFPMRVTSGERVIVIPRGEPGNMPGSTTNTNFNMTVNTGAAPGAVINQFEVMRALVG